MDKQKRPKLLFIGDFRYSGELITKFAYAFSGRQAKVFMMRQIANDHEISFAAVCAIFDGQKANFEIKVDPEWKAKYGM